MERIKERKVQILYSKIVECKRSLGNWVDESKISDDKGSSVDGIRSRQRYYADVRPVET